MRLKRKIGYMIIALTFVVNMISYPTLAKEVDNLVEMNYVGPGRFDTDLMIIDGEILGDYYDVGNASIWNTREEFIIQVSTKEEWKIDEIMIYVGQDAQSIYQDGQINFDVFQYKATMEEDTNMFEWSWDLLDDLDISWGKTDESLRMTQVAMVVKVKNINYNDGESIDSWAVGNNTLDNMSGWWMNYIIEHPDTGHFIDAPVTGVSYVTPTNNGITDAGGAFDYMYGEAIELFLGKASLGITMAQAKVTPQDLTGDEDIDSIAASNMARMLQSFDSNGEPTTGIEIDEATIIAFNEAMSEEGISEVNFYNDELVESLIITTISKVTEFNLQIVSIEDAVINLNKGTNSSIYRKNISKTEDSLNEKAKLEMFNMYVPAQKADGSPVSLIYSDDAGNVIETRDVAIPLLSCYTGEVNNTSASDVFVGISRDDGATWQRTNISKSADRSSFTLENGQEYMGTVYKPQVRVKGEYIFVVWTSKFANSGNPKYAIKIGADDDYQYDNNYYEKDIWGVSGPQRSIDYTDEGYPEVGEIPFSVVWSCRGKIDPATGDITWFKPERITSGRRDANQITLNGVEDVGFAFIWQEDQDGLRPGEEAGPGEGWSGATTNHKTDIWYSTIMWEDFEKVDVNFESHGVDQIDEEYDNRDQRVKALVPCSLPIRLSDNDTVNTDNMKAHFEYNGSSIPVDDQVTLETLEENEIGDIIDIDSKNLESTITEDSEGGTHRYGFESIPKYNGPAIVDKLCVKLNNQNQRKYVAVTGDGRLLDGDTGASRPNIMLQKYTKQNGESSAWAVVCYEETKGVGAGSIKGVDVVASASIAADEESLINALSSDGTWIATFVDDVTMKYDLIVEGEFYNNDVIARELALYTSDESYQMKDEFTLTVPNLIIRSENTRIKAGSVVGDIYVEAMGFHLNNVDIVGNIYYATEEIMNDVVMEDNPTISGVQEIKTYVASDSNKAYYDGKHAGQDEYVPDEGKNVIYHTFDMFNPDMVSAGTIINSQVKIDSLAEVKQYAPSSVDVEDIDEDYVLPGLDTNTNLLYITDESGETILDMNGQPYPAYENARRPRMLIQGKSAALKNKLDNEPKDGEEGTVLVMVYKMGEEGKGRPSDIFMRRWVVDKNDKGNPYSINNLKPEEVNISTSSIPEYFPKKEVDDIEISATIVNEDRSDTSKGDGLKVLYWEQTEENLDDDSWENPNEDARAHRGILRGDKLAIAYDYTPNWAAQRNGNDKYDLYLRRSFDGGETFTTNPKGVGVTHTNTYKTELGNGSGSDDHTSDWTITYETKYDKNEFEPARNLSQLTNNKLSVIEPRLVGGPASIVSEYNFDEDIRNTLEFWVTYGTSTNPDQGGLESPVPDDLYYSYTSDFGDTFYEISKIVNPASKGNNAGEEQIRWDWLAKDTGSKEAAQAEAQIRMKPDGETLYAVWNETNDTTSDVMFRKINIDGTTVESVVNQEDTRDPIINILGINDGDRVNENVNVNIDLNEAGEWTAELTSVNGIIDYSTDFVIQATDNEIDYTLTVEAKDLSNNESIKIIHFTIFNKAPTIIIDGIENGAVTNEDVKLDITTIGIGVEISLIKDDQITFDEAKHYDLSEEGNYKLKVKSTLEGFESSKTVAFNIDKTAPIISISGVDDGEIYSSQATPTISITDNMSDSLELYNPLLDGKGYISGTTIYTLGEHKLTVEVIDLAGNISSKELSFIIRRSSTSHNNNSSILSIVNEPVASDLFTDILDQNMKGEIKANESKTIEFKGGILSIVIPENTFDEDVEYIIVPVEASNDKGPNLLEFGNFIYKIKFFDTEGEEISTFKNKLQLIFEVKAENIPFSVFYNDLHISYWDETINGGTWIIIPSTYDSKNGLLTATIDHLSIYGALVFPDFPTFKDCDNHWAQLFIYKMASRGICCGDAEGNFNPNQEVTREDLAKILVESLDISDETEVEVNDMETLSNWAQVYVRKAVASGVMLLDDKGNFNGHAMATREDLFKAAMVGFDLEAIEANPAVFEDSVDLSNELLETINKMTASGIISGYPDQTIRPNNSLLRCELIKVIAKYLQLHQ